MRALDEFLQDVRFGIRTLVKNPGLTATAVLSLALATGATTAIFSVVNNVLLRPLPFAAPEQLMDVSVSFPARQLEEFRRQNTSFESFTWYSPGIKHLESATGTERLNAVVSDREFFATLGVQPIVGRSYRRDDPRFVAVISERLWTRRFRRDPAILGRSITLDGNAFTVLGVMPETFQFPYSSASVLRSALAESLTDVWVAEHREAVGGRIRRLTGRLKPGVSRERAAAEWSAIRSRIEAMSANPNFSESPSVEVVPLSEVVLGPIRRSLWLLFGAVGLVLAAACANVANLLLALTSARVREVATRAALGATQFRLIRQFLAESLLLSLAGGVVGVAVARWGMNLLIAFGSQKIPRAHEIALDWTVFGFLLLVCVMTAVLFGLAPALAAARADIQGITKESGGHATTGRGYGRLRDALVVTEVALAFVLAFGAAAVMIELSRLRSTDTGMEIANVVTFHLGQRTAPGIERQYYDIANRVSQLSGVQGAGFIQALPLQNWGWTAGTSDFRVRGRAVEDQPPPFSMELRYITPGYFQALGIPVVKGRGLTDRDTRDAPPVIVMNETLAQRYFGSADPIGAQTTRGTIVGVVADVRQIDLDRPAVPELYYPMAQNWSQLADLGMSLVVRTHERPEAIIEPVRALVREVNPNLAIFNIRRMDQVLSDSLWDLNLYLWLIGLFAGLALLLAAIGLYGVISYSVAIRGREWAVRLALGSDPAALARLVLRRGLFLCCIGIMIGVLGTLAFGLALPNLPIALNLNAATFARVTAMLLGIALLASLIPAIRITRIAPAAALRVE